MRTPVSWLFFLALPCLAQEQLGTGFRFTEGPAADAHGSVYFTDIPNQRIHRITPDGTLSTFREKSGRANGLMFNAWGELVACEGGNGRVVAIAEDGKTLRVLADEYDGRRFNAPNDLVIDRWGGIYFTDPEFGRDVKKPQRTFAVYYIQSAGNVRRIIESLPKPNGILLSPDEKTLYVVCSGSADVMAYPIRYPGALKSGRVFFRLLQPEGRENTGGDGLTCDTDGNLYITSWLGVQVVSPDGKHLRTLAFPEKPANVTFGGKDRKTLFVTARTSVYTLPMEATGHRFGTVDGHLEMGLRHRSGVGARLSHLDALRRFERSIAAGSTDAVFWRAMLLLQSDALDGDRKAASRTLHDLRHQGNRNAVVLGYIEEIFERPSPGGGFHFVEKFAKPWVDAGDAEAQVAYGYYLLLHRQDEEGAFAYWRKAAEAGNADAQWLLMRELTSAIVGEFGKKREPLIAEARKWAEAAAYSGVPEGAKWMHRYGADGDPAARFAWLMLWKKMRKESGRPLTQEERKDYDDFANRKERRKSKGKATKLSKQLWKRSQSGVARRNGERIARSGRVR